MRYRTKWILTAALGSVLTLVCLVYSLQSRKPVSELVRPESGAGDQSFGLEAVITEGSYPVNFVLLERPYEEEEIDRRLKSAAEGLEKVFLGANPDCQHVTSQVFMPSVWPETEISIQWYLDSWEYLEPGGRVKNELLEEAAPVQVQAILSFEGQRLEWERSIVICPPSQPDARQKIRMLEYELQRRQEEDTGTLALPQVLLEEPVAWYHPADDRWKWALGLTLLALCALALGKRKDEEREAKRRERSLQMDYPEIVSRLSLYMGAGISTRNAWERIVDSYEKNQFEKKEKHAAYEEMRTALYEMQSGVPETLAYERFGTRCRVPAYLKLGTLLGQNLRKGTRNLAGLLEEESREAFEDRKALAKKLGEECESRLLLPMLLLLLTVLIMVMYPAVVSFQM